MIRLLEQAGPHTCHPGGSASNVVRAAARFGATARLVGARADDRNGELYATSLRDAGICTKHLIIKTKDVDGTPLSTASCCVISNGGQRPQRSMRTMFANTARLEVSELRKELLENSKYLFVSSYACYFEGMISKLVELGAEAGCKIFLDLGSFEIVNAFSGEIDRVFGNVDICVCNEDEAAAFSELHSVGPDGPGRQSNGLETTDPHRAFDATAQWMLGHGVKSAVIVTLGDRGCILYERADAARGDKLFEKRVYPAIDPESSVVDSTGAGDAFCGGMLFALSKGMDMARAVEIASTAGSAAVKSVGAVLDDDALAWFHRMHRLQRDS